MRSVESYRDLILDDSIANPEDDLFCECNLVSKKQIEDAAQNMIYNDFLAWLARLNIGEACGSCLKANSSKNIYSKFSTKTE